MTIAYAFVFLHSWIKLRGKNTIIFFTIMYAFGFISELLGAKYGWIFGNYYYNSDTFFFGVEPFMTPISWTIIIYTAYTITNLLLSGFNREKFSIQYKILPAGAILLIILSSIDGLIAMNLDMILDPVNVDSSIAGWVWIDGGPYYNIPISNFIGWFLVTFLATIIFRFYSTIYNKKENIVTLLDYTIPILYLMYLVLHSALALHEGHQELVLIGVAAMIPFILIMSLSFFFDVFRIKKMNNLSRQSNEKK